MLKYVLKRILLIIPTVLGVLLIIFTINYFTPGDPVQMALGTDYTQEQYEATKAEMGLDKPFLVRYVNYVVDFFAHGSLGTSYDTKRPVMDMILQRLPITLRLGLSACAVTIVVGILVGIVSAVKQYSVIDYLTTTFAVIFSAAPAFWVALMAIIVFCLNLKWFDAGGIYSWRSYILPVICLAVSPISLVARMTRTSMLDVIRSDYIRTARAKGVAERSVIFNHALKNALIPILTVVGMQLTTVLGGSFIIESVFSIPGIGMLMLTAINNRDYPTTQGVVLLISIAVCIINLLVDLAYAAVDPCIKSQYSSGSKKNQKAAVEARTEQTDGKEGGA